MKESTSAKQSFIQFVKFTAFSASAGVVQIGVFTALDLLTPFSYWPCYLPALIASVVYNFTLNRKFTFKSANNLMAETAEPPVASIGSKTIT